MNTHGGWRLEYLLQWFLKCCAKALQDLCCAATGSRCSSMQMGSAITLACLGAPDFCLNVICSHVSLHRL